MVDVIETMVDVVETKVKFDNQFTRQFGLPGESAKIQVKHCLMDDVKNFIRQSPMLIMATSGADGSCDASPRGGKPGFVKILDDYHILIPDVAGNHLFQSYINISENPNIGLIFFIPGVRDTARVNGRIRIVDKDELDRLQVELRVFNEMKALLPLLSDLALDRLHVELQVFNPDENAKILQGIIVEVEEAFAHCPRALAFSDFWNLERIEENKNVSCRV